MRSIIRRRSRVDSRCLTRRYFFIFKGGPSAFYLFALALRHGGLVRCPFPLPTTPTRLSFGR